ncbi:DUF4258 domain-containing protein [Conexibacter arvalis]|uniref:Uncharacterized DUF497 family protein n=1 Tax=Conexibacter arvalis TaxID=912552 RepID=A0A840IA43_9ACTN|nr:DUF4258 domain-containing protein [Conexibacter arvalis]MBB4661787.1 uncharacterized DUF497 family protein [Conexibacter arvalis]
MPDAIVELLATEAAISKLGARDITTDEARQLPRNAHTIVRNPREEPPGKRRIVVGRTNGGRALTLVVERTIDPTTWLIVTGWESSPRERRLIPR